MKVSPRAGQVVGRAIAASGLLLMLWSGCAAFYTAGADREEVYSHDSPTVLPEARATTGKVTMEQLAESGDWGNGKLGHMNQVIDLKGRVASRYDNVVVLTNDDHKRAGEGQVIELRCEFNERTARQCATIEPGQVVTLRGELKVDTSFLRENWYLANCSLIATAERKK